MQNCQVATGYNSSAARLFATHFKAEMSAIGDDTLEQELELLEDLASE